MLRKKSMAASHSLSFKALFTRYVETINRRLAQVAAEELSGSPDSLYAPARYMLSLGGKRLRPALTLLICDLLGGDVTTAERPAVAVEMFHNFTLIHDDIMDKALLRRNQPTVHEKWDLNTGILSGDLLLIYAYKILTAQDHPRLLEILHLFNKTAVEVCEGQQYDMDFERRMDVTEEEYLCMITLKTATLLGACLQLGGILADAPTKLKTQLYSFGKDLGIAFQIQDDILDLYGEREKVGKQQGGDIIANKKTFLFIKALELATPEDRQRLRQLFSNETSLPPNEKVAAVQEIFDRYDVYHHTCRIRDAYYERAMHTLQTLPVTADIRQVLTLLARGIVYRDR